MFKFDPSAVKVFPVPMKAVKKRSKSRRKNVRAPVRQDMGPVGSRRDSNKQDKLRRITAAARALFIAKGYDATSLREIAQRAGVALGTPFSYAADKRDLLFLTVNDELEDAARRAAEKVGGAGTVKDNLLAAFGVVYAFFGQERDLSRLVLREMQFYQAGPQAARFMQTRQRMIDLAIGAVARAQQEGEIARREDAQTVGMVIFSAFQMAVRLWLMRPRASVAEGLRELEGFLDVILKGLAPSQGR